MPDPKYDEFGVLIKSSQPEVDEFGIPVKKKTSPIGGETLKSGPAQSIQTSGVVSAPSSPSKSRLTYQDIDKVIADATEAQDAYSEFEQKYSSYGAGRVASADAPDWDQKKKLKADLDQKKAAEAKVLGEYAPQINRVWQTVIDQGKTNYFFNGDVFDEGKGRKFINDFLSNYGGEGSGRLKEYMLALTRNKLTEEKIKPEVNKITGEELAARGVKFNPETNEYEYKGVKYSPNTAAVSIATRKGAKDVEEYKVFSGEAKKRSESALTIAKNEATQLATSIGQLAEQTQKRIDAGEISVEEGNRILSSQYEIVNNKIKTINSRYTETVARLNSENRKRYSSLNKNLQTITKAVTPEELDAEMPADLRKVIMDGQKAAYQKYYKSKNIQRQVGDITSSLSFGTPGTFGNVPLAVFGKGAGSSFLNFVANVADGFISDGYNNKFLDWASSLSSTAEEISPGEYNFRENPGLKLAEVSGQAVGGTVPSLTLGFILSRAGLSGTAATLLTGAFDAYTSAKSSKGEQYSSRVGIVAPSEAKRESDEVFGKIIAAAPLYAAGGLGDFINVAKKGFTTKAAGKIIDMSAEASTSVVEEYAKYEASGGKDSISKFVKDNPQIVGEAMIGEVILSSSFSGIGKVFSAINTKTPSAFNQHIFNSVSEIGPEATVGIINKYYEQGLIDKGQLSVMLAEVDKVSKFKLKMEAAGISEDKGQLLSGLSEIEKDLKVQFESEQDAAVKAVLQKKLTAVRQDISELVDGKAPFMTFTLPGGVNMKKSMTAREFNELSVEEQNEMIKTSDGIRVVGDDALQTDVTNRKSQLGNNPEAEGAYTQTPMQKGIEQQREDIERRRQEELETVIQTQPIEVLDENGNVISTTDKRVEINAKYDAELAALNTTQPEVSKTDGITLDKGVIASNAKTETETIKALPVEEENGATLNIDGTKYTGGGLVIPVASKNTTQAELTPEMLADFIEEHKGKLSNGQSFKVGYYKFPGSDQVSIDLNIVVDPKNRAAGLEFGRLAGQESLFDLGTFENIKTGADGSNPRSFSDAEFADIANSLNEGKLPSFMEEKGVTAKQMAEELRGELGLNEVSVEDAVIAAIPNAVKSLEKAGIKFEIIDSAVNPAQSNAARGNQGIFISGDGTIVIDKSKIADAIEAGIVVWHEASHPVMNIIRNTNKPLYDAVVRGLNEAAKNNKQIADALNWAKSQPEYDNVDTQNDEAIVETIGRINAGVIDIGKLDTGLRQKLIDLVNSIAKFFGINPILDDTDITAFKKTVSEVADALKTGRDIAEIVGEGNVKEYMNKIDTPEAVAAGSYDVQARATESSIDVYESKEVDALPRRSLEDIHSQFEGKAVVINSDPTRVGELTLPSGKKIFMYGGPGYLSVKDNVNSNIGFATTQLSKVKSWAKYISDVFGNNPGVTLVATQAPTSILSNSYALRYVMDAVSTLPKSVLRSSDFKTEFFGKDLALLKDAFGEKAYSEFVSKYKKADLSDKKVIDDMIAEMAYKIGDDNKPASFKARGAFVSNLLGGLAPKSSIKTIEGNTGYVSKKPQKFIAKQLMDRLGINAEKVIRDIGEPSLVDLYMNEGKWGMAVSGFETDPNLSVDSVQEGGVKHPLFNAKFPGKNPFLLDGAYEVDKIFKPVEMTGPSGEPYTKKAAQMLAGSMYVKGMPTEVDGTFEYTKSAPAGGAIQSSAGNRNLIPEARQKKLTDDGKGNYVFFHRTRTELKKIDPKKFGSNLATGRDERPGVGISMFYVDNKTAEPGVPDNFIYAVRVPKEKVYPINEDPLNFYDEAKAMFEKDYPGQAFDANKQVGYITKVANKNGFDITVVDWNIKGRKSLRAQTTQAIKPEVYKKEEFKNGSFREVYNPELDKLKPGIRKDAQSSAGNRNLAPNGKPSNLNDKQYQQVRTPEFKNWFGDWENDPANASKVVDENGEPRVVYHGTSNEFNAFAGEMQFFSTDKDFSKDYGDRILEVFIDVRKPFDATSQNDFNTLVAKTGEVTDPYDNTSYESFSEYYNSGATSDSWWVAENYYQEIQSLGYDGGLIYEGGSNLNFFTVSPYQIKSATDNTGEFSTTDNRIQASAGNRMEQSIDFKIAAFVMRKQSEGASDSEIALALLSVMPGMTPSQANVIIQDPEGYIRSKFSSLSAALQENLISKAKSKNIYKPTGRNIDPAFNNLEVRDSAIDQYNESKEKSVFDNATEWLGNFKTKWLDAAKGLPNWVLAVKDISGGMKDLEIRNATDIIKKLKKTAESIGFNDWDAFSKAMSSMKQSQSTGIQPWYANTPTSPVSPEIAALPDEIKPFVFSMRGVIDRLSGELVASGYVNPDQALTIESNLGEYVNRAYKMFNEKGYKPSKESIKDAQKYLADRYIKQMASENPTLSFEEIERNAINKADKDIQSIISKKLNPYFKTSKEDSRDTGVLKERKDIPAPIRKLMGEYTDPGTVFVMTVAKQASLIAASKYLTSLRRNGLGSIFFEENDPNRPANFSTKIASEGSETKNPLGGLYTTPEIAEALESVGPTFNDLTNAWMKLVGAVRWGKTVGSVVTQLKNFESNVGFAVMNGLIFSGKNTAALKGAGSYLKGQLSNTDIDTLSKKVMVLGLVNQSVGMSEIKKMLGSGDINDIAVELAVTGKAKGAINWLSKPIKGLNKAYQLSDDFWKVYAYMNERELLSKAMYDSRYDQLSAEEQSYVDIEASERVKNTFPTYDRVWKGAKYVSERAPIFGNFISFQAEVVRVLGNTIKIASKDMKSDDPSFKALGYKRLAGVLSYVGLRTTLTYAAAHAAGIGVAGIIGLLDDEEEKEKEEGLRKALPSFMRSSDLLPIPDKQDPSKYTVFDLSSIDPYGILFKSVNALTEGREGVFSENMEPGVPAAIAEFFSGFLEPEMTYKTFSDLLNNYNPKTGGAIINEDATKTAAFLDAAKFVADQLKPSTIGFVQRLAGDRPEAEVGSAFGARPYDVDLYKSFGRKMSVSGKNMEDVIREYNRIKFDENLDREEKDEKIGKVKERMSYYAAKLSETYNQFLLLGADADVLDEMIKTKSQVKFTGFGKDFKKAIKSGNINAEKLLK